MTSDLQRDTEVVDSLIRGVWGAEPYELEAWQRIKTKLQTAEAPRPEYDDHSDVYGYGGRRDRR